MLRRLVSSAIGGAVSRDVQNWWAAGGCGMSVWLCEATAVHEPLAIN